jgi:hypothetical protein
MNVLYMCAQKESSRRGGRVVELSRVVMSQRTDLLIHWICEYETNGAPVRKYIILKIHTSLF